MAHCMREERVIGYLRLFMAGGYEGMLRLSGSEMLLYGGVAIMLAAVVSAAITTAIFKLAGKRLREKLEKEYGKQPY